MHLLLRRTNYFTRSSLVEAIVRNFGIHHLDYLTAEEWMI
jgi:hypothetical protein